MKDKDEIIENLKDAGCCEWDIANFLEQYRKGNLKNGMKIIECCRKEILANIHEEQRKIDCLDYLVYEINRDEN